MNVRFVAWALRHLGVSETDFYSFMADEERIFREGTAKEQVCHRFAMHFLFLLPVRLLFLSWQVLALFLLGALISKRLVLTGNKKNGGYRRMLVWGFLAGISLQILGGVFQTMLSTQRLFVSVFLIGIFGGALLLGLSYASGVALACARWGHFCPIRSIA